ncbi:SufE family protein [Mesorhizobium sp. LHD-90]|uniref:SufE family protein n=1 Tax=Mesorhizobium sp. LHD-90 TaxID=3071414 RepID=UPI0027E0F380|nr:SufE family protein [Mesorhizobium sp. LHD-90]MDQ6436856.1 SufE family protein [Mesorhizobium sp. LHD-90]
MMNTIQAIRDDFAFLDEWEDKYRYVIDLGESLPAFPEAARDAAHKVQGCVSQVWLVTQRGEGPDPVLTFLGDSDAHIVRGLVAIMLALFSGRRAGEIVSTDAEGLMRSLGLNEHLTPQRANGLRAMVKRIKQDAQAALS